MLVQRARGWQALDRPQEDRLDLARTTPVERRVQHGPAGAAALAGGIHDDEAQTRAPGALDEQDAERPDEAVGRVGREQQAVRGIVVLDEVAQLAE